MEKTTPGDTRNAANDTAAILYRLALRRPRAAQVTATLLEQLASALRYDLAQQPRPRRILKQAVILGGPLVPIALRRRLFQATHRRLGGRLRFFICGDAAVAPATRRLLAGIGLPVVQPARGQRKPPAVQAQPLACQ